MEIILGKYFFQFRIFNVLNFIWDKKKVILSFPNSHLDKESKFKFKKKSDF